MRIKVFQINKSEPETEVAIGGYKFGNMEYFGWLLIIYFPKDGSRIYFRGLLS